MVPSPPKLTNMSKEAVQSFGLGKCTQNLFFGDLPHKLVKTLLNINRSIQLLQLIQKLFYTLVGLQVERTVRKWLPSY
jgi:hypothetical protein